MKKKIIVICSFLALILISAIFFIVLAKNTYNYELTLSNEPGTIAGLGAFAITLFGGMVVFYELDLFYTVYYFLIKPKTKLKSILNILSNLSLLLAIICDCFPIFFIGPIAYEYILGALFLTYVILRIVCLVVSIVLKIKKNEVI